MKTSTSKTSAIRTSRVKIPTTKYGQCRPQKGWSGHADSIIKNDYNNIQSAKPKNSKSVITSEMTIESSTTKIIDND